MKWVLIAQDCICHSDRHSYADDDEVYGVEIAGGVLVKTVREHEATGTDTAMTFVPCCTIADLMAVLADEEAGQS